MFTRFLFVFNRSEPDRSHNPVRLFARGDLSGFEDTDRVGTNQ